MDEERLVQALAARVVQNLRQEACLVPLGVSNRHLHLCRADMDILFGAGSELTYKKALGQPGQYAAEETVTLSGPKGQLTKVRVLGPLRAKTQIEISISDGYTLGVKPPVRDSGNLEHSIGLTISGPAGQVKKDYGAIAALRHIHLDKQTASLLQVQDNQLVDVEVGQERGALLHQVLVRVSEQFIPEMHLDLDEANAMGVGNGDKAKILLPK